MGHALHTHLFNYIKKTEKKNSILSTTIWQNRITWQTDGLCESDIPANTRHWSNVGLLVSLSSFISWSATKAALQQCLGGAYSLCIGSLSLNLPILSCRYINHLLIMSYLQTKIWRFIKCIIYSLSHYPVCAHQPSAEVRPLPGWWPRDCIFPTASLDTTRSSGDIGSSEPCGGRCVIAAQTLYESLQSSGIPAAPIIMITRQWLANRRRLI